MSPIVSGNFRQTNEDAGDSQGDWGQASSFARSLLSGRFLKPEGSRRKRQEVSLNLFYNFLDGSLTGHKSQMANSRHSRDKHRQAQLQIHTHPLTHTRTHTELASCGCANQKCRKDESIKNIYMRVHFCISLLAMTETVRVVVSLSLSVVLLLPLQALFYLNRIHTHTHIEYFMLASTLYLPFSAVAAADAKICRN